MREARGDALEGARAVLVLAAQLFSPLGELEGRALVAARDGPSHAEDAEHRDGHREERHAHVLDAGAAGRGRERPDELADGRVREQRERHEPRDEKRKRAGRSQAGRCIEMETTQIIRPSVTSSGLARPPVVAQSKK